MTRSTMNHSSASLLITLILSMGLSAGASADDHSLVCEKRWNEMLAGYAVAYQPQDAPHLLGEWKRLEDQCKGTGVYEVHLATLYIGIHDWKSAQNVIESLRSPPDAYAGLWKFLKLTAQLGIMAGEKPIPMAKVIALRPQYLAALDETRDWYIAWEQVANYMLLIQDYPSAIAHAEKSIEMRGDQWEPHRTLTIAYAHVGEYQRALDSAGKVRDLRPGGQIVDRDYTHSIAKSYAGIGQIKVAEKILAAMIRADPSEKDDPGFADVINFITMQLNAGNVKD